MILSYLISVEAQELNGKDERPETTKKRKTIYICLDLKD